jgi:Spy/CpxP family protein refolding chaperone
MTNSTNVPCWRDARIIAVLLVVFAGGAAVGALAFSQVSPAGRAATTPKTSEVERPEEVLDRFHQELDLTAEQRRQLEVALDDYFQYYHTLKMQMDEVRASGKRQILAILDQDQRRKFEAMVTEFQEKKPR